MCCNINYNFPQRVPNLYCSVPAVYSVALEYNHRATRMYSRGLEEYLSVAQ